VKAAMNHRLVGAVVLLSGAAAHAAPLTADVALPRAFGYQIGDRLTGSVTVRVPAGLVLDPASLPAPGSRGQALELRSVSRHAEREAGGERLVLTLDYQVFVSPPAVRTFETPTLALRFTGMPREETLRVEPWPVTVAPLAPVDVSSRRGLGELLPDVAAPAIDTRATRLRLQTAATVALLAIVALAQIHLGLPWWGHRRRPFARAWRELRRLPSPGTSRGAAADAVRRLHAALNATAGEVVFAGGIDRTIAAHPRYAALRGELLDFFALSNRVCFVVDDGAARATGDACTASSVGDADLAWLRDFCRRCRDAERGTA
jgi:mxaA protein